MVRPEQTASYSRVEVPSGQASEHPVAGPSLKKKFDKPSGASRAAKVGAKKRAEYKVKAAASSDYQPKGVRDGRASHVTAKATDSVKQSEATLDVPGAEATARFQSAIRDRRDPIKTLGIRPKAERARSRKGVRGARSTDEGGDKPLEGRGPASVVAVIEGKREGMPGSAKRNRTRRFPALYDRICRSDVLREAWKRVKNNGGAAGVDEQTLAGIEESCVAEFLENIQVKLRAGRYRPSAVRRRSIEKADGKQRPLGMPTVRDRVVQMATKLVIETIFEADFLPCSYGFRPKRGATQALEAVREAGNQGRNFVLDRYWDQECKQLGVLVRYADDSVVMFKMESQVKEGRVAVA